MKSRSKHPTLTATLATLAAIAVVAAFPGSALGTVEYGLAVHGGFQTYSMSDLNDEVIAPINVLLTGTGLSMDEVTNGVGFGGGLRIRTPGGILVALDYTRLTGSSELSTPLGSFTIDVPGNTVVGTVTYLFPSESKAQFGLGGGLGYYSSAAKATIYDDLTATFEDIEFSGNGFGLHGLGCMDYALSPVAHVEANVGYRYGKTSDLESEGVKLVKANGDDATLDWSGLMTRVGMTFYFGNK